MVNLHFSRTGKASREANRGEWGKGEWKKGGNFASRSDPDVHKCSHGREIPPVGAAHHFVPFHQRRC